ncbi:ectonucleotide pyrophosphatase/phosphodiesterase family member 3-like isoform X2 [Brassica napus]|uniref:ectonucleotide pyrophosphatase/phosphodiesterase family member 3-like isoform X2 n=1 Tax=Brassica napus TaxID=3708 RepID=UPI00207AD1B0|nr:ectonucleotide pyrophosphatase/phosphodiesterase family member 3-like isoform X2 [Brassica napus]
MISYATVSAKKPISSCFIFAFIFFSSQNAVVSLNQVSKSQPVARPLKKLDKHVVLLISSDGFRFGYQFKTNLPNIHRLIANGTEAETGLIPVFPTVTYPNHYSIVTGLYPAYHGIINNNFVDPKTGDVFTMASHEPEWWLGEPLWETAVNQGLKAATYIWPGSEVGPDDSLITEAVVNVDRLIGRFIDGLEKRGVFEDVSMIMVGDHGMVGTCDKKVIVLDDLSPWIKIPSGWVQNYTPLLAIKPPSGHDAKDVVAKMNQGLRSGKVENGKYLKVYLKEDLPKRLHYADSDRIAPIIGLVDEGYKVEQKKSKGKECGGAHGYDNAFFSMRSIFIGHGPLFSRGRKVASFENVEIYNLICSILGLKAAPNNGSDEFASKVLLPRK